MSNQTWNEANSLFWVKHYRDKVAAFESGEIYTRMQKEHREELAYQDQIIRRLKRDLAKAKAENRRIVRYWMQMAEDVRVECEKEKALMRKEIEKMRAEKEEALRQRDEAKKIAQEKREEAYQAKSQAEEIQQKNDALTARIIKDFTNSSKPSSMDPNHTKIANLGMSEYEYMPPNKYFRDGFNLCKRMKTSPEEYTLFLKDPSVPPTNNLAERCARKYKRKAHQMMSFRGDYGDEYFCDVLSILETLRLRKLNLFKEISSRFALQ